MPKRRLDERDDVRRQQHLYLLLDDWHSGYSVRKVRLPSSRSGEGAEQSLPRPFMHFVVPRGTLTYTTSAFGTKIMVVNLGMDQAPVVDVLECSVLFSPGPNQRCCPIFFPVSDDKLFFMDVDSFEICRWSMKHPTDLPWNVLSPVPFDRLYVSSYAVQPDVAIIVSTKQGATAETYVFDVNEYPETLGYLYSCSVTSTDIGNGCSSPTMKRSREKVYSMNPAEKHVKATLVYMMGRGKFCLVECIFIDDASAGQELRRGRYMYRLMTFSLGYDMEGELKLEHCRVCYYNLPREATTDHILRHDPMVFWL
ncbi:unnamed protein product [Urochloa decumbens]|uniref:F-box protein n=1 Tax=Urochloa decumbens TaxID=240449 RepID=A0ABC8XUN3_9POAL